MHDAPGGGGGGGPGTDPPGYWSRVVRIFNMLDARLSLVSSAEIEACRARLRGERSGRAGEVSDAWARKVVDTTVHPQTGEVIFAPLRLSFVVPANLMLDTLMLLARGPVQHVAAQFTNQSYNALHYYANRNESNPQTLSMRAQAFCGATVSACACAVGIERFAPRSFLRFAPLSAVAAADVFNIAITRRDEFSRGICLHDAATGEKLFFSSPRSPSSSALAPASDPAKDQVPVRSKQAGASAVGMTIAARVGAATPILLLPPLAVEAMERRRLFSKVPWLRVPTMMALVGAAIQFSVPLTFAVFAQRSFVRAGDLEPEVAAAVEHQFSVRADQAGERMLYFNRGL